MAKTKYIVPAVAMLLCAVSLIGAGYAAYSATLQDNENVNLDSNYYTLTLNGATDLSDTIDIYYDYAAVYTEGTLSTYTYTPYLDANTTTGTNKALLGAIKVDGARTGDSADSTGYTLALTGDVVVTGNPQLTDVTVKVYTTNELTTEATGTLAYANTYYVALVYVQDGDNDQVEDDEPDNQLTINYSLLATAVFA